MKRVINFKVGITEMYPRIPWKLIADRLESAGAHCYRWSLVRTQITGMLGG